MLNTAGLTAGIKKELREFKIPAEIAEREIKRRNGNIILVKNTVRLNLYGFLINPGAIIFVTKGENRIPSITIKKRIINIMLYTLLANSHASFNPFSFFSTKTGIKEADKALSAKKSRKRFGILKAT